MRDTAQSFHTWLGGNSYQRTLFSTTVIRIDLFPGGGGVSIYSGVHVLFCSVIVISSPLGSPSYDVVFLCLRE